MRRFMPLMVLVLTCLTVQGFAGRCYAERTSETSLADLWTGTTRVTPCAFDTNRCNAVNNITFRLVPNGSQVKGEFTCAYGDLNCRNGGADDMGKIVAGTISGNLIRLSVVVPADVSNCYYNGQLTSPTTIHGAYSCYQGGGLLEQGVFDLIKSSGK